MTTFDQEIMARTAMGEARSEGQQAMLAVMWTGKNRYLKKHWYTALTLAGTFLMRAQYSCWNTDKADDANRRYICDLSADIGLFKDALGWAAQVITGGTPDPTGGATHYYDSSISPPTWVDSATKTVTVGKLSFYKNVT